MFNNYKSVFILSLVMAAFVFVPFYVTGFSTDVWTRLARIEEWAGLGFPWRENLMMGQNFPYGHEMHWTRPLDFLGYAFAWPFIPGWGLHEALEIMAHFVPPLILLLGVAGFFYGVRGYVAPKIAFVAFWLFFFAVGQAWGQGSVGYYDHHIALFTLHVWTIALMARYFLTRSTGALIAAAVLTALGTWILFEFFINSYILILPFALAWLYWGKSLKPAIVFTAVCTAGLLIPLTFDHPMSGFGTLDLWRTSLFHAILGGLTLIVLAGLEGFGRRVKTDWILRGVYGLLGVSVYIAVLVGLFPEVITTRSEDAFMYAIWMRHITELAPLWRGAGIVPYGILPILLAAGGLAWALRHLRHRYAPLAVIAATGAAFYAALNIMHVRFGVYVHGSFVFLAALYVRSVFFPRERSRGYTLAFVVFCCLFFGALIKGDDTINRLAAWGKARLDKQNENKPPIDAATMKNAVDRMLSASWDDAQASQQKTMADQAQNGTDALEPKYPENENYRCYVLPDDLIKVIRADARNGGIWTDIFAAPEILWKTGKPVFGGPYHSNVDGLNDLFAVQLDRPPYTRARDILKRRNITQLYMQNPRCFGYLYYGKDGKFKTGLNAAFNFAAYYETKDKPAWLELEYADKITKAKVFRVVDPPVKKKSPAKKQRHKK
ncbi:MAG: hypothetical protein PHX68_03835 [Alphaproteobacteria bacterium]|nr:hypothetical protein [Alphaproteobacteria bacterium]